MQLLSTPSLYLLLCLEGGERHGYELLKLVGQASNHAVSLGPATLYTTLQRLIERNLIAHSREEVVNGRTRRYYRITGAGTSCLAAESERLRHFLSLLKKETV